MDTNRHRAAGQQARFEGDSTEEEEEEQEHEHEQEDEEEEENLRSVRKLSWIAFFA